MTLRLVGGIAAATFAIGMLSGAAGTIVARDATTPRTDLAAVITDHMGDQGMRSMMSGGMMSGSLHDQHHPATSQDGAK
jgi:hypothetical protein